MGLFAIANEVSRLIDNNFEQSKKASGLLREDLQEISKTMKSIFESIKVIYPKNENIEPLPNEPYIDVNVDTTEIASSINNVVKELTLIKKILVKRFIDEDDEDFFDYNS